MMVKDTIENFFTGDGTSQQQRSLPALSASYAKMDDRGKDEMLNVIYKYAAHVFYYSGNDPVNPEGDWQSFFRNNISFQYALIQQFKSSDLESAYDEARNLFVDRITMGSFWPLFNRIMAVAVQLNTWQNQLDANSPLYRVLQSLIKSDFSKAIARLVAVAHSFTIRKNDFANDLDDLSSNPDWDLTLEKLFAVDYRLSKLDPDSRRKEVETLAQLDDIFRIFYKGIVEVQQYARANFEEAISGTGSDEPHLGLLYAFLRLFIKIRDGKNGLNDITARHLDFFYKDVLGLKHQPHQPDHVHVVVELAKQVNSFLLGEGAVLKDGKDKKGKDISFLLENETVFNKAVVEQLRTLFKDKKASLYAAPIANSADGMGTAFQDQVNNSWPVLGTDQYIDKNSTGDKAEEKSYPFAKTGFVLSSSVLLLQEGVREIFINIDLKNMPKALDALSDIFSEPFYLINASSIAAFEKAGVSKESIKPIAEKVQQAAGGEVWLKGSQFKKFTSIDDSLIEKAKSISMVSLLEIFYSSVEGWQPAPSPSISFDSKSNTLTLKFTLQPGDKPVSVPDPKLQLASFPMKEPGLKIIFNHRLRSFSLVNDNTPWYDVLSNAIIDKVYINVQAKGVKNVLLSNDDGLVDPNKKFFPFTSIPKKGSNFFIGSNEVFRKKLTGLKMIVEWDGLPEDFKKYYEGYPPLLPLNIDFTATLQKLNNATWESWPSPGIKLELFTSATDPLDTAGDKNLQPVNHWIVDELDGLESEATAFVDIPVLEQVSPLTPFNINSVEGFIRLILNRDFYHQEYPFILANSAVSLEKFDLSIVKKQITNAAAPTGVLEQSQLVEADAITADGKALDLVNGVAGVTPAAVKAETQKTKTDALDLSVKVTALKNTVNAVPVLPKPPYTPAIKSFSFDYTAAAGAADIELLHLYPFEETNYLQLPSPINNPTLFPPFDMEGCLFIGIKQATAGTNISLLFQLSEYSADPNIEAAEIEWSYLKDNDWIELKKDIDITSDTTQGLLVSGIVTISLPWMANTQHTILPPGYHWLKIAAPSSTRAVCEAIVVAAQAASAVFHNQENDLERLGDPLPANSIAGLVEPRSEIKKISQPYPSFRGKGEESDPQFYIRVSERLRHKGRSITIFDYERLVLQVFPAVFKVKCIPNTKICRNKGNFKPLAAPGWVTLAVIPDISGYKAETRLEPAVGRIVLKEIENYFLANTSGFVMVQAINPEYQTVDFEGNIKFMPGKDELYYKKLLETDVRDYLSPWIKGDSKNIVFGGTLMMSSVLQFIENRVYVSYVTDFVMKDNGKPVKAVTALNAWMVLVSGKQSYGIIQEKCSNSKVKRSAGKESLKITAS
jgi:hypothetical protein